MSSAIILGTRPEIIKMSPVIREFDRSGIEYFILHTGQHYSYNMDRVFFEQLKLPEARYNLEAGTGAHGEQTGKMLAGIEKVLMKEKPEVVLVQGDTNTVLAGALAASKLHITVGHVEAGLRSYDKNMPEEINRVLADHCSDYLFAHSTILLDSVPASIFDPTSTVSGLSVLSLSVTQGTPRMHVSSCTPPESERTRRAPFSRFKKSR